MEFTNELRERLLKIAPAQFGHHIEHGFMHPRIKPVEPFMKLAGPAVTVRATERDGSALYYAIMKAPKGSVIVVDRGEEDMFAIAGDQLVLMMKHRELGGLVIDGPATDRIGLGKLGFPVFCTGFSPVTTLCKGTNGVVQVPVQCGGAVVHPGDIILGDADGVIALSPKTLTEELVQTAENMTKSELIRAEKVEKEGYRFLQRDDMDVIKFFEYDKEALINDIKKECRYDK
ncbi:MAG: RraA family protein [Lachnospiraceae bacterium]|nr:RraA family protein [Lachnospiraceae bacterium]